jgi:hypothetical protein
MVDTNSEIFLIKCDRPRLGGIVASSYLADQGIVRAGAVLQIELA